MALFEVNILNNPIQVYYVLAGDYGEAEMKAMSRDNERFKKDGEDRQPKILQIKKIESDMTMVVL